MTYSRYVHNGHEVRLVWNSRIARLCGIGYVNCCVTISAHTILVARDWISRKTLAHEFGHIAQAKRLGWRYLPWVLWTYLRAFSYRQSKAEQEADCWMYQHAHEFPNIGDLPSWVKR